MDSFSGIKEMYDVNIKLNHPVEINGKKFLPNETILLFKTIEISQITQNISSTQSKGGYHNVPFINWDVDRETNFSITHGVLSPMSWALLSNSKIKTEESRSVPFNEIIYLEDDGNYCIGQLKYSPNHLNYNIGAQGNPERNPLPQGRKPYLLLKPLPAMKNKYIYCYDYDTGQRIDDFQVKDNLIYINQNLKKVYVDYTFNYEDKVKTIEVGNRLINGFLSLSGKMSVKDENSGEVTTAIVEMPKIKLSSSLYARLGKDCYDSIVSDFSFTAYIDENVRKDQQKVFNITFLDTELTEDYI